MPLSRRLAKRRMRNRISRGIKLVAYAALLFVLVPQAPADPNLPRARSFSALEKHMIIRAIEAQGAAISTNRNAKQIDFAALNSYKRALHEIFFLYWINAESTHAKLLPDRQIANFVRLYAIEDIGPEYRCEDPLNVGDLLEKDGVTDAIFSKAIRSRMGIDIVPSDSIQGKSAYRESAAGYQAWLAKLAESDPSNN